MSDKEMDVKIGAQTAGLTTGLDRATHDVEKATLLMKQHFGGLATAVERLKVPFLALGALLAGGEIFKETIEGTVHLGEELEKASQKTGLSVDALSRLRYAAQLTDVSFETVTRGLQKLALSMQGAQQDSLTTAKAYEALGIRVTDAGGHLRSLGDMLPAIAEKFSKMENGTQKTALAMQLFGRGGAEMIPLLNKGAAGLQEMGDQAALLGDVMGTDAVGAAEAYEHSTKQLHSAMEGLSHVLATTLMPVLRNVVNLTTIVAIEIQKLIQWAVQLNAAMAAAGSSPKQWLANVRDAFAAIRLDAERTGKAINRMLAGQGGESHESGAPAPTEANDNAQRARATELEQERKHQLALLALERDRYEFEAKLGEHSAEDQLQFAADMVERERQVNEDYLQQELSLFAGNEKEKARIRAEMAAQADEFTLKAQQKQEEIALHLKATIETMIKSLVDGLQNAFTGLVDRTTTFRNAMLKIGESIEHFFIQSAFKWVKSHFAMEQAKTGATALGSAQRTALEAGAATKSLALSAASGLKTIAIKAAEAMASAYAAIAAIPFVGPFLAPAAAIGAGGAVLAFGTKIASAEHGYDIPAGVNPITQLHQSEMVLPAELANVIRGMAAGGGGGGGNHYHFHAMDAQSFRDFAKRNPQGFADGVKSAMNAGHLSLAGQR